MRTMLKKIYYCEFCKTKKGLSASHMSVHEKHCTLNAGRECRVCGRTWTDKQWEKIRVADSLFEMLKPYMRPGSRMTLGGFQNNQEGVKKLDEMIGCPVCTFTYLRTQIGEYVHWEYNLSEKIKEYWSKHPDAEPHNKVR